MKFFTQTRIYRKLDGTRWIANLRHDTLQSTQCRYWRAAGACV